MLKNDFIFWKAFGKIENKEILTNFIQDLTGEKVENLVYHEQNFAPNAYQPDQITEEMIKKQPELKASTVEIAANINQGTMVTVEKQDYDFHYNAERDFYYLSKSLKMNNSDIIDDWNCSLRPIIGIYILDFNQFTEDENAIHTVSLMDRNLKQEFGLVKQIFFELNKPNINVDSLERQIALKDWQTLLKNNPINQNARDYIQKTQSIADYNNLTTKEKKVVDILEKAKADYEAQLSAQHIKGKKEVAQKLLKLGVDPKIIIDATGLKKEEL
ncbi:PD-(D/E)XK nuclease family transposase [Xylocopilactobacillus apis]|nr:PD-(D/E)XK nuclease family transposase [Xylocopilactobacillus apis]